MSQETLSRSAQTVQNYLIERGYPCQVIELSDSTRTAQEAADALGCTVAQIIKSLVFKTKDSGFPILVLASGPNRVNEQAVAAHVGHEIVKADATFTRAVTGFAIGGIPPAGHPQKLQTFIDKDLLQHKELWAAAGTPHAVFKLESSILEKLTSGIVISVA